MLKRFIASVQTWDAVGWKLFTERFLMFLPYLLRRFQGVFGFEGVLTRAMTVFNLSDLGHYVSLLWAVYFTMSVTRPTFNL